MDTVRLRQVDAFTTEPLSGNPAGVVPDATGLSDGQMAAIARELAVSETAFCLESEEADHRLRYFTPDQEIDCCGHATIATFAHLYADDVIDAGTRTVETNTGVLEVRVEDDGTVWLRLEYPEIRAVDLTYERVAEALGVEQAGLEGVKRDLPLAVVTAGVPVLVVPITYLSDVGNAEPELETVAALAEEFDAIGIYLFSFDTLAAESTVHGRLFAPSVGIPEDPVTGTASAGVGAYLEHFGAFDPIPDELQFEQGHYVDRPGLVRVQVGSGQVDVGGRAVTALEGTLVVPGEEEDEILEA